MRGKKLLIVSYTIMVVVLASSAVALVKAQTTTITLNPSNYVSHSLGEKITMSIVVNNVQNLWSWDVFVSWDPSVLNLTGVSQGSFLKNAGSTFFIPLSEENGTVEELSCSLLSLTSVSGSGVLANLVFNIMKEAVNSQVILLNTTLVGPVPYVGGSNPKIDHQVENASVTLILGEKPVANAGQDQTVDQGTQVVLNGSRTASSDPNATYIWSFIDGTLKTLEGKIVNYTFNTPGTYNIQLFVQDSNGNSTDTTEVIVKDTTAPVPKIFIENYVLGQPIIAQELVTLDGSASTDPYSTIQNYIWDMGDGSAMIEGNPVPHAYNAPGTYNVTMTVVDAAGNNATAFLNIEVTSGNALTSTTSIKLNPYILGILSVITALAVGGSVFWFRRRR